MLGKLLPKFMLLGFLITLVGCTSSETSPSGNNDNNTEVSATQKFITVADISNNPAKKIQRFQPMADYLAARLADFGITAGEVKIAPDLDTMANWLKTGEVDICFDSPYPAMIVSDRSQAVPILRRWKGGQATYNTVIFGLKSNGIKSLADLQGKTIAFDEPYSTSGYLLPLVYLLEAGFNLVEKQNTAVKVSANEIGYVFSSDDENAIQWVISGKVAAAAVDTGTFAEIPATTRQEFNILTETEKVARHVVLVRAGMEPELQAAIKKILLEMEQTEAGKAVLEKFEQTAKFDDFPTAKDIDRMRQLYESVQDR